VLSIGSRSIFLHRAPVNMLNSFAGLSALVEREFPGQLLSGSLFVFVNRRKTLLKLLYWDGDGLALWYKRLEKGTFRVSPDGRSELSRREFLLLLEGIRPRRMLSRFSLAKSARK
jgi:transposase